MVMLEDQAYVEQETTWEECHHCEYRPTELTESGLPGCRCHDPDWDWHMNNGPPPLRDPQHMCAPTPDLALDGLRDDLPRAREHHPAAPDGRDRAGCADLR